MQWRCTNCGCVCEGETMPHLCDVCGSAHHFEDVDFSKKRAGKIRADEMKEE